MSTSTEREIPKDFPAGWQNVCYGKVEEGDLVCFDGFKCWAEASIGRRIYEGGEIEEWPGYRAYRRIPTPKQDCGRQQATTESVCQEAHRLVMGDRQAAYNHPAKDFDLCARFWSVLFGIKVKPEQVGMAMILVKLAREMHRHKRDNCTDMAGYAQTIEMVHEERERTPDFP